MPLDWIDNVGEHGVIRDIDPSRLPRNAWSDANHIRFNTDGASLIHGNKILFDEAMDIAPIMAFPATIEDVDVWFYMNDSKIYVTDGATEYNVTRSSANYSANTLINWTGGILSDGVLVFNNAIDPPQQWVGTDISDGTLCANLSNWPDGATCKTLRPFKEYLIALGIDEGSGYNGTLLRWSNPAVPGSVPTSWDYADPAQRAGRVDISQTPDELVDCAPLGGVNVVYKEHTAWAMRWIGGNNVFEFRNLFSQIGALSRRCIVPLFNQHFVVSQDDVIVHDGSTVQQILNDRQRRWLFNNIDSTYAQRTVACVNLDRTEIVIAFPMRGYEWPSHALIWNWTNGAVYNRDLPYGTSHLAYGYLPRTYAWKWDNIGSSVGWNQVYTRWSDNQNGSVSRSLVATNQDSGHFLLMDSADPSAQHTPEAYLIREAIPLGYDAQEQSIVDSGAIYSIYEIYPQIAGTPGNVVEVYVGARNTVSDTTRWHGPYYYTVGTTYRIPVRLSGRYLDIQFRSETNSAWTLNRYGIAYRFAGTR